MTTTDQNTNPIPKPKTGLLRAIVIAGLTVGVLALGVASALAVPAHVLSSSFGSVGSGAGQVELAASSEVAVNQETHDIYVADAGNHRVDVFNDRGEFQFAFGANVGGSGVDVCTTICVKGTSSSSPGAFEQPVLVTVDNSSGPSKGDVYVGDLGDSLVSKFTGSGSLVKTWVKDGQLGGFTSHGEGMLAGVAVALGGDLFAIETNELRFWFDEGGVTKMPPCFTELVGPPGLASDRDGDLYFLEGGTVRKFSDLCEKIGGEVGGERRGRDVAIDFSNSELYLTQEAEAGEGGDVQVFAPACSFRCTPIEEFAFESGELKSPQGIAVDPGTHTVYVADFGSDQIDVYTLQEVFPPTVTSPTSSSIFYTSAHVSGEVSPNGHLTSCRFEYSLSASFEGAQSTPCESSPGAGTSPVKVDANPTGLKGSSEYHVRLVGEDRGIPGNTTASSDVSFHTLTVAQPTITIDPVSAITPTSAHFSGEINPNSPVEGPAAFDVQWSFGCVPQCTVAGGGTVAADDKNLEVATDVSVLKPGETYKVMLSGENANAEPVPATAAFTTPAVAPGIHASFVSAASGTEATLTSLLDPGGAPTTYRYEYISEAQYLSNGETFQGAEKTPESSPVGIAGDNEDHEAQATLTGLSANTNYRFRIVANNDITSVSGEAELLYTRNPEGSTDCANKQLREENDSQLLPNCRAYEQVSPADNAEAFVPSGQNPEGEGLVSSQWPMQAAGSGEALAYVAEPSSRFGCGEGTGNAGGGEGDEQLATRGATGWVSCDIQPLASNNATSYQAFSDGLEASVLRTGQGEALQSGVPGHCDQLYARASTGPFAALFAPGGNENCLEPTNFFVDGSGGYAQIAFESKEALAASATASSGELGHENLYLAANSEVHTVNVLPGPSPTPEPDATIGALSSEPNILAGGGGELPAIDTSNAVSADGSHMFWTALSTDTVYVRVNPSRAQSEISHGQCTEAEKACTLQVSEHAAIYQTATPDGRYAYYTEAGKLWRYDTATQQREALANSGVLGVLGVNETGKDGEYLYFVSEAPLAAGTEARKCETAPSSQASKEEEEGLAPSGFGCNLYVIHDGETKLATVLLASDNEFTGNTTGTEQPKKGDWRPVLGYRSAELNADGQNLAFMSGRKLSSYQNINPHGECGGGGPKPTHSCVEIYRYSATSEQIACVSCDPSGAPPTSMKDAPNKEGRATYLPGDFGSITHQRRLISANGSRIFYNSDQPLSPQDKNGVQDVYEWEQESDGKEGRCGKGSTSNGDGCVSLLSGGTSTSDSLLLDADETGDNVFFVSRAALVPGGGNGEKPNVFDARVNGGFKGAPGGIIQPPECKTAEECKEPAGEPPVESFPASAAFSGAGNLIAPLETVKPPVEKPAPRKLTRAQELAKALKACRKQVKRKRAGCVKQVRRRYGPIEKKAKRKGSGKK
jgi:hypothetical protein